FYQGLRKLHGWLMGDTCERSMAEGCRLPRQCGDQPRMVVAKERSPPGSVAVDDGAPIRIKEPRTRSTFNDQRLHFRPVVLHLRVGMPDDILITPHQVGPLFGCHVFTLSFGFPGTVEP